MWGRLRPQNFLLPFCWILLASCAETKELTCNWGFYHNEEDGCYRWAGPEVRVRIAPSMANVTTSSTDTAATVNAVVDEWQQAFVNLRFNVSSGGSEAVESGEILVRWIAPGQWQGPELAPAQTRLSNRSIYLSNADVQLNGRAGFALGPSESKYHLTTILRHEFGHALGFTHYTHERSSIMFPIVGVNETKDISFLDWWNLAHVYKIRYWPTPPPPGFKDKGF